MNTLISTLLRSISVEHLTLKQSPWFKLTKQNIYMFIITT